MCLLKNLSYLYFQREHPMKKIMFAAILLLAFLSLTQAKEIKLDFKPEKITVYQQGAYIDFEFDAEFDKGMNKIIIDSLPFGFDPNGFLLKSDKKILINSMDYETHYFDEGSFEYPKSIQTMEDSLSALNYAFQDLADQKEILNGEEKIIKEYSVSVAGGAKASVQELQTHANYYAKRVREIRKGIIKISKNMDKNNAIRLELQKKIDKEKAQYKRINYQLVANIKSDTKEKKKITFSCFTNYAGWNQNYDIRVKDTKTPMNLSFIAKIWQNTQYKWEDVKLVVSTRNPTIVSVYHEFEPWRIWVGYRASEKQIRVDGIDYKDEWLNAVQITEDREYPVSSSNYVRVSRSDKSSDFDAVAKLTTGDQTIGSGAANYFAFEYSPDERYTIESGKKPTSVILNEETVDCEYKHISQPKVTSEAFLIAKISDWGNLRLLNGPANVYLDNSYIGKSRIDVSNAKDTLLLSLGRVRGVVTERTKMKEFTSDKFFGSNVKRSIGYKINVINNKPETITITVQEQVPVSTNEDITIEVLEKTGANYDQEKGLLEWVLELKPGESKEVKYIYEADMPSNTFIE
jgi:uncharacterized protein (TIGR02231 family)